MNTERPLLALFSLTGFGNAVLPGLCAAGFAPAFVTTRSEPGAYPHYPEEPLPDLAARLGIPCFVDADGERRLAQIRPHILLVATYHRLLKPALLATVPWAVNLHPSLLPIGRGPNPFYWTIRNGDARTGVTAHLLTDRPDAGPILWQRSLAVESDETQGSLRRRLAGLAVEGAIAVTTAVMTNQIAFEPQDERQATTFSRPPEAERIVCSTWSVAEAQRFVRAWSPFPGAFVGGRIVTGLIGTAEGSPVAPGTIIPLDATRCRMRLADGDLVLALSRQTLAP